MKYFTIATLSFLSLILGACSSLSERDIDVPHIDANSSYFGLKYSQNVVRNIEATQASRVEEAWSEGVSFTERLEASLKGVDPYVGWAPKVTHPAIEEHTKTKYEDVIELILLFDTQPVDVVANDDLILLTFPQNYLWSYSGDSVDADAAAYIEKAGGLINKQDVRFSVYAQESFKASNFGKQWVSKAKADRFRDHLINAFGIDPRMIQSFGIGNKIAHLPKYSDGDFVQLVIYHKYDVDSSKYLSLHE